jgi:tol-pal system protein YbgF
MQKYLYLGLLLWTQSIFAQIPTDMLQQQVTQLRQTVLELDTQIAQQNIAIQQLRGEIELLQYQVKNLKTQKVETITPSPVATTSPTTVSNKPNDKKDYQKIYLSLESGNDEQAINDFQQFLVLYPHSQYADDAQYWLAESYYSKQDFISALVAYEQLIERYARSSKRAQAELKIAYCYYELKDFTQAKNLLTQVKQNYPYQAVARLATKKLREIEKKQ